MKNRDVLARATRSSAASRDFFGTAYGQAADLFDGFQFGAGSVQDETLLLIGPEVAKQTKRAKASEQ